MVKRILPGVLMASAAVVGCQAVAGINDRQLDPAWSESTQTNIRKPPERPAGEAKLGGGAQRRFIVRTAYLGTVDPVTDAEDVTAWKRIGYDLDGKCTTSEQSKANSSGVCSKSLAAQEMALEDGDDCRDNAAGRLLANGAVFLASGFEKSVQRKLDVAEVSSMILQIDDLADGADDTAAPGRLYMSMPRPAGQPPIWNGSDEFFVDTASVEEGDLQKPKYYFPRGYMKGNVWVSGDLSDKTAAMPFIFYDRFIEVEPDAVVFTVEFNATHDKVLRSVFGAVLNMQKSMAAFGQVFYESLCSVEQTAMVVNGVIGPNADLISGPPPFVDPNRTCDAMSIGWMLKWEPVKKLVAVSPSPPPKPGCDGGV